MNIFNAMKVAAEVAAECGSERRLGAEPGRRQQSAFTGLKFIDGLSSGLIDPLPHRLKTATAAAAAAAVGTVPLTLAQNRARDGMEDETRL